MGCCECVSVCRPACSTKETPLFLYGNSEAFATEILEEMFPLHNMQSDLHSRIFNDTIPPS